MDILGVRVLQTELWLNLYWKPLLEVLGVCVQLPASAGAG